MDKELLYNQSGIKDETAYKAITKLQSEGVKCMNGCEINKGEIWEVESGVGTRLVVVIACYEKYAATVMLQEQEPIANAVQIRARNIMYADAGRLGYMFYDKLIDFVRALSEDEDQELRRVIGAALELGAADQGSAATATEALRALEYQEAATKEATAKLEAAREEIELLQHDLEEAVIRAETAKEEAESLRKQLEETRPAAVQGYVELVEEHSLREDLAAVRREAEIYKGLYETMLARALG